MEENIVEAQQLSDLCRLCASKSDQLVPIFEGEGAEHNLALKIRTHLPIQILDSDTLPVRVCHGCTSTLIHWDVMVVDCVAADRKLRALQWSLQCRKESWRQVQEKKLQSSKFTNSESLSCSVCNRSGMDFRQLVDHLRSHKTVPSGKRKHCPSAQTTSAPKRNGKRISSPEPVQSTSPKQGAELLRTPVVCLERLDSGRMLRSRKTNNDILSEEGSLKVTNGKGQGLSSLDSLKSSKRLDFHQNLVSCSDTIGSISGQIINCPSNMPESVKVSDSYKGKSCDTASLFPLVGVTNGVNEHVDFNSKIRRPRKTYLTPKRSVKGKNHPVSASVSTGDPDKIIPPAENTPPTGIELSETEKPSSAELNRAKPRVRIVSAESINQSLEQRAIMSQKIPMLPNPIPPVSPVCPARPEEEKVQNKKNKSILIPAEVMKQIKTSSGPQLVQLQDGRLLRFSGLMGPSSKASFMSIGGSQVPGKSGLSSGIYALPDKSNENRHIINKSLLRSSSQTLVNVPPSSSITTVYPDGRRVMVMPKPKVVTSTASSVNIVPTHPLDSGPNSACSPQSQQDILENIVVKKEPVGTTPSDLDDPPAPPPSTKMKIVVSFQQQPGPKHCLQKYTCALCGKRNLLKDNLSTHAETHKPTATSRSSQAANTSVVIKPVQAHPSRVPDKDLTPNFMCHLCGEGFRNQTAMDSHTKFLCNFISKD